MRTLFALSAAGVLVVIGRVRAQESNVTCASSYDWAKNSLGQNPCVVASYLLGVCYAGKGNFTVNTIPEGYHYLAPNASMVNPCICSSPVYNLVSACGACVMHPYLGWNEWTQNCGNYTQYTPEGIYPRTIPNGTRVPAWAYIKLSDEGGQFDPVAARSLGGAESTFPGSASQTSSSASGTGTNAPSPSSPPSGKSSNAGAIAGGVVGGLAALVVLATIIFMLMRKKKRRERIEEYAGDQNNQYGVKPGGQPPMATYSQGYQPPSQHGAFNYYNAPIPNHHNPPVTHQGAPGVVGSSISYGPSAQAAATQEPTGSSGQPGQNFISPEAASIMGATPPPTYFSNPAMDSLSSQHFLNRALGDTGSVLSSDYGRMSPSFPGQTQQHASSPLRFPNNPQS